jgi:hypothetical protein
VPGQLAIEESTNGGATWATAWSVSGPRRERYLTLVAEDAQEVDEYQIDKLDSEMACTSIYVVPGSRVVLAACGLAGFVRRDAAGVWTMLGFDAGGSRLDRASTSDEFGNWILIIFSGCLILLIGAEAHALRYPRGKASAVQHTIAILVGLACSPVVPVARGEDFRLVALPGLGLLFFAMLSWFTVYLVARGQFPWWTVLPAVLAPVAAWNLHSLIVRGEIYATPGWTGIWAVLGVGLIANILFGIWRPGRRPQPSAPAATVE